MTTEIDSILEQVQQGTHRHLNCTCQGHIDALAAEVRRLRGHADDDCACAISSRHEWFIGFCEERDKCNALRQRHAAAVEKAFREGFEFNRSQNWDTSWRTDAAWLASEAKARLT